MSSSFNVKPTAASSTLRNDISGAFGWEFSVPRLVTVTRVGRLYIAGNTQDHLVKIWGNSSALLATATILAASASDSDGFKWVTLGTPITLATGTAYEQQGDETIAGDQFLDAWTPSLVSHVTISGTSWTAVQGGSPINISANGKMYSAYALDLASPLTYTGPSSGANSVASTNFTVSLNGGSFNGSQTITLSDGSSGGTFTPSVGSPGTNTCVVTPANTATSFTFTYTPVSSGAKTISVSAVSAGWILPASLTYTVLSPGDPSTIFGANLIEMYADDPAYLFTDSGTTHVASDADAILQWNGQVAGASLALTQSTSANRPRWDALLSTVHSECGADEWMNVPSGLAFDTQHATFFIVCEINALKRPVISDGNDQSYHGFFESANFCNFYFNRDQIMNVWDGSNVRTATGGPYFSSSMQLIMVVMDTGGVTININGATASLPTMALRSVTGGRVLGFNSATYPLQARVRNIGFANVAASSGQQAAMLAWAQTRGVASSYTAHLGADGDSLTHAYGSTLNRNWVRQMGLSSSIKQSNVAESGIGITTGFNATSMTADAPTLLDNQIVGGVTNALTISAGVNDIQNSRTGAQTYADLVTYIAARKTAGWNKIVVLTPTAHGVLTAPQNVQLADYNSRIYAGYDATTLGADAVVPIDTDPNIGLAANTSTAYYFSDHAHLTNLGYAVKANIPKPFVMPLLGLTASSYTVTGPSTGAKNVASAAFTFALVGSCTCNGTQQFIVTCPANVTATATAAGGTISNNGTGTVTVTPAAGQTGFTFTLTSTTTGSKSIAFTDNQRGMTRPANASITIAAASGGGAGMGMIGISAFGYGYEY